MWFVGAMLFEGDCFVAEARICGLLEEFPKL